MKFSIYQESRIGGRKANQDRVAYCYSRDALLMVVADGMGGHLYGEVAAHISVQFVTEAFQREARPTLDDPALFMSRALTRAHAAILDYALDKRLGEAPRTTIVACIVQNGIAYWAHAGDSRLYLLRGGRVEARTKDHSRVQLMIDHGLLTPEEAEHHPERNRVYSCLGGNHPPQIEFSKRVALRDADVVVLCTDGAWGPLRDDGLVDGLAGPAGTNVLEAVPTLMTRAEALAGAGSDNLSMIAMRWHDESNDVQADAVSTQTMALDRFTTKLDAFERTHAPAAACEISDDDIERAIAEINNAIRKYSR